mgnify:CR=1 FL=1
MKFFEKYKWLLLFIIVVHVSSCGDEPYDILIIGGTIYDGFGDGAYTADIAIKGDTIAQIGDLSGSAARKTIHAKGLSVAPGFINVLSWADLSLLEDGRGMSDLMQGVTLEIFGEGISRGPLNESMQKEWEHPEWETLEEFMQKLTDGGVSPNVASTVGATNIRIYVLGYDNVKPNDEQLKEMQALVENAMLDGALGVSSSLIYTPANYASTEELITLAKVAKKYGGIYTSHLRSEGNNFEEAVDEFLEILQQAKIRGEIYHLKAAGKSNWRKLDNVIAKIDSANSKGIRVSTNMYTYTAAATGLNACMPPWVKEGGESQWLDRLKDPALRNRIISDIQSSSNEWENFYTAVGDPRNILATGFKNDSLQQYSGKSIQDISDSLGLSPEETIIDLIVRNDGDIDAIYFLMSEENIQKKIQLPYMSFCSDSYAVAPEGDVLLTKTHPRAYGTFSRLLGKYVYQEKLITKEEAIRRLTLLPAINFGIERRGAIREGWFADLSIFDFSKIKDNATFTDPHQYSSGIKEVIVNGELVLSNGEHTGNFPGKIIRGPGYIDK